MILTILQIAVTSRAYAQSGRIHWKPVNLAQVKLDEKTPLASNVYRPDKKKDSHFVLVLLGRRYIELDIKAKLAYSVLLRLERPRRGPSRVNQAYLGRLRPNPGG